jgi:hypothetical protein
LNEAFLRAHHQWVEEALENGRARCETIAGLINSHWEFGFRRGDQKRAWSQSLHRQFEPLGGARERSEAYARGFTGENHLLSPKNTIAWEKNAATADT